MLLHLQLLELQNLHNYHVVKVISQNLRGSKMSRNRFSSQVEKRLCLDISYLISLQKSLNSAASGSVSKSLKENAHQQRLLLKLLISFMLSISKPTQNTETIVGDQNLINPRTISSKRDA